MSSAAKPCNNCWSASCTHASTPAQQHLCIVHQCGLLLRLHRHDALHKVLMVDLQPVPPERKHARLHTHRFQLRCVEVVRAARKLLKVDVWRHVHLAAVDLQDLCACVFVRVRELNLAVEAAAAHKGGVQDVCAVGGSDDLQCRV
eukprot:GHRQ01027338.1.p1 GENE.GHRQ01027338.1~~GHRQ01027338.1.p1  ORF type:complete len:145 (+),score=6.45 GHRQ01027338.1:496-930(+)